jgi:hypothetical protein
MEASDKDGLSRGYGAVLWRPDEVTVRPARITRFTRWLAYGHGPRIRHYDELWQWSVTRPAEFWTAIVVNSERVAALRFRGNPRGP